VKPEELDGRLALGTFDKTWPETTCMYKRIDLYWWTPMIEHWQRLPIR
jgi:hypothetical protein